MLSVKHMQRVRLVGLTLALRAGTLLALEAAVAQVEVALAAAAHTHPLLHRTATLGAGEIFWSDEVGQRMSLRTLVHFCKNSQSHHSRIKPHM